MDQMAGSTSRLDLYIAFKSAEGVHRASLGRQLLINELTFLIRQLACGDNEVSMNQAATGLRTLAELADDVSRTPETSYAPTPEPPLPPTP